MAFFNPTIILLLSALPVIIGFLLILLRDYLIERKLKRNKDEYLKILLGAILDLKISDGKISEENLQSMLKALEKLPKHRLIKNTIKMIKKYPLGIEDAFELKFKYTLPILLQYFAVMTLIEPSIGSIVQRNFNRFRHDLDLDSFINNVIGEIMVLLSA